MAQLFNGRVESSPPHTSVEINYEYSRNFIDKFKILS